MSWLQESIDQYYKWLKDRTTIVPGLHTDWMQIQTPFTGLFNDTIDIYAKKVGEKIFLSDNGDTFTNLELVGVNLDRSSERKLLADRILLNYGIKLTNGELLVEASTDNFNQKKHNLLSAVLELTDLEILSKETVKNLFKEDVGAWLKEKKIIFTPEFISKGSTGLEFLFDFQIAGYKTEKVIKAFNTLTKQSLIGFLFSWEDIGPVREKTIKKEVSSIAIINDVEKPVKPEYLDALNSKGAKIILWSERDTNESIQKLEAA